ncbi:MAG: hypothetical protein JWM19_953 [Actinomycetia bacterium]|nr:hypothetical protein [Actinomycetes bacterium]
MTNPGHVISPALLRVLLALGERGGPLSGRHVARITGLSPTTAIKRLSELKGLGAVSVVPRPGRATLWQPTAAGERVLRDRGESAASLLEFLRAHKEYADSREVRCITPFSDDMPGLTLGELRVLAAALGLEGNC